MTAEQVKRAYEDKEEADCPITKRLIKAGYQQESGGYIEYAYSENESVDYTQALPTQWWHLLKSYCARTAPNKTFGINIQCGELIVWMAEVLECVDAAELSALVDEIIASGKPIKRRNKTKPPVTYERAHWNGKIQELCFDKIVSAVERIASVNG